jgi:hypothetical protein
VQEPAARTEGRKANRKKARVWAEGLMSDDNEVVWCGVERDGGEEGGKRPGRSNDKYLESLARGSGWVHL